MSDPTVEEAPLWYRHIYPAGGGTRGAGFYHATKDHAVVYLERSPATLIVTFDNLSQVGGDYLNRDPWATKFVADEGHSHLGVMANGPTWFRDPQLIAYLEKLRDDGFFVRFDTVVMAGTSMGAFAALTFSRLVPGARVIAFSPQSTLKQDLVPWEHRFFKSRLQDWTLPYSDAAEDLRGAGTAYVIYDPFDINDARQAARLPVDDVTLLRAPGCGHKTAMVLRRTETLKTVMRTAIDGTLTAQRFAQLARGRRNTRIYCLEMIGHLQARGHHDKVSQFKWAFHRRRRRMKKSSTMSKLIPTTETFSSGEATLIEKGAREGFYRNLGPKHSVLFSKRGGTLLVTFENLDHVVKRSADQLPWGYSLAEKNNWSILGLMAREWSWYRDTNVLDFFDELRASGFFDGFERVIFYGASMGAYAACAFSSACPGADVIAISPQATLDRSIASWETRYRKTWRRNFSDRYGFAPDEVRTANRVVLVFDPASQLDAMHAALFRGDNITRVRCRFMGHRIMSLWGTMGVLKEAASCLLEPQPDIAKFRTLMRKRYESERYQKELLAQVTARQRDDLIVRLCTAVLSRRRAPHFRRSLRDAKSRLAAKQK